MADGRVHPELRRMQKVANQRIRELERKAPNSPALRGIQATLEMMGKKKGAASGRRFSETGKGDIQSVKSEMTILRKFLEGESTIRKYKGRMREAYNKANEKYDLAEHGISQADWHNIWANASDKMSRPLGSEIYIEAVERMNEINGKRSREDQLSIADIVSIVNTSKTPSSAYEQLGINYDWEDTDDDYF